MPALQLIKCMAINNSVFLSELSFLLHKMGLKIYFGPTVGGVKIMCHGIDPSPQ